MRNGNLAEQGLSNAQMPQQEVPLARQFVSIDDMEVEEMPLVRQPSSFDDGEGDLMVVDDGNGVVDEGNDDRDTIVSIRGASYSGSEYIPSGTASPSDITPFQTPTNHFRNS